MCPCVHVYAHIYPCVPPCRSIRRQKRTSCRAGTRRAGECEPLIVPYGADLDAKSHASGFKETEAGEWNLSRLPTTAGSLLDAEQEIPWADQPLNYFFKWRFWYQEYKASPPSHATISGGGGSNLGAGGGGLGVRLHRALGEGRDGGGLRAHV